LEKRSWSDGLESQWEGVEVAGAVETAFGDLTQVADRLSQARAGTENARVGVQIEQALDGVTLAVNALLASADIKCTLAQPPVEVNTRPRGPNGEMITRCFHAPAHCWNGIGNRITPCP
jgi:hypothetical protein